MFVAQAAIAQQRKGSLEERIAQVRAQVQAKIGADAQVVATHEGYALVQQGHGDVKRVAYQVQEGQVADLLVEEQPAIPSLSGYALERAAQRSLREIVEHMLTQQPIERTRVRDLAQMVQRTVPYWPADVLSMVEAVGTTSEWWTYYEPQALKIRERLHGRIREIEEPVPATRYSRLPEARLAEYVDLLREDMGHLRGVALGLFDELKKTTVYHEERLDNIHRSLQVDAGHIGQHLERLEQMDWKKQEVAVATTFDRIAARLRDALVVQAHLRTLVREQ